MKPTKSRKKFFKIEMLNAIVDLVSIYDDVFLTLIEKENPNNNNNIPIELTEDMNLIFVILHHLFHSVEVDDKLVLMMDMYKKLLMTVRSPQLKSSKSISLFYNSKSLNSNLVIHK